MQLWWTSLPSCANVLWDLWTPFPHVVDHIYLLLLDPGRTSIVLRRRKHLEPGIFLPQMFFSFRWKEDKIRKWVSSSTSNYLMIPTIGIQWILKILSLLSCLIIKASLNAWYCCYSHFTVEKLRPREIRWLAPRHTGSNGQNQDVNWIWVPSVSAFYIKYALLSLFLKCGPCHPIIDSRILEPI